MTFISATADAPKKTFAAILADLDDVREDGNGYVAVCPAHADTEPSLRLALNTDNGNLLIACRASCSKDDVLKALGLEMSDLFGVEPGGDIVTTTTEVPDVGPRETAALAMYLHKVTAVGDQAAARAYALRRFGITPVQFEALGLGVDDGTVPAGGLRLSSGAYRDVPRLVVPFRNFDGVPQYLQARALGESRVRWSGPSNPEGAAWGKYGWFESDTSWSEVVIAEGPGDALTAVAAGYDAVAVRGAGLSSNSRLMDDLAGHLRGRRVIVAGDNDEAGRAFARALSLALVERGLTVHTLGIPAAADDLTDWRERMGKEFPTSLARAVQSAAAVSLPTAEVASSIGEAEVDATTDVERASLVHQYILSIGKDLAYVPGLGWHLWAGTIWEAVDDDVVRWHSHLAGDAVRLAAVEAYRAAASAADKDEEERLKKRAARIDACAKSLSSTRGVTNVLAVLRSADHVRARVEDFDQQPSSLGVKNGIIDLRTGALRPWSKEERLTRRLDVDYRPTVEAGPWAKFVSEVFVTAEREADPEYVDFMQRLIGYGITGETREHLFGVMYGEGRNGKSRFIDAITGTFEGITRTTSVSTFEERGSGGDASPDLIPLRAARLVMASESGADRKFDEARIKSITGGDRISARDLYSKPIEFKPQFLILLATNHKPNFRGQDEGLWRRVKLLPFSAHFPEGSAVDDPRLDEKLAAVAVQEEILSWAVAGSVIWYDQGLRVPARIRDETASYRVEQDRLAEFFGTSLVFTGVRTDVIKGTTAWTEYMDWVEAVREGSPLGRNGFLQRLATEPGVLPFERAKTRWFRGVRLPTAGEKQALIAALKAENAEE